MNRRDLLLALLAVPLGCGAAVLGWHATRGEPISLGHGFQSLSLADLNAKMSEAKAGKLVLQLIDNNSLERWKSSHIPGAKWVLYDEVKASDLPADKTATLVFYCANEH